MINRLIEVLGKDFMFWYGLVCVVLFGLCIGSFLNVVIFRLIKKESLYKESSHCMKCLNKIKWYDNIPLVSYIVLKGKCRSCGTKISLQYPLVETLNALLCVFIYIKYGYSLYTLCYCVLVSVGICIAIIDLRTLEIEPHLQIVLLLLGVIVCILDRNNILLHIVGAVCLSLLFLLIYFFTGGNGIGFGDVKLIALLGLIVGWKDIYVGFIVSAIIACVVENIRKSKTGESRFAFGPYLVMGAYLGLFLGEPLFNWYFGIFA